MKRLMFLSIALLSTSTVMCMDREDDNGNLTSFEVCGVSYDRNDDNSWSMSLPEPTMSHDDIMTSIDNTISSYESTNTSEQK